MNTTIELMWAKDVTWRGRGTCWDYVEDTADEYHYLEAYTHAYNSKWLVVCRDKNGALKDIGLYRTLKEAKAVAEALVAMRGTK